MNGELLASVGVPAVMLALLAFLAKAQFDGIRSGIKEIASDLKELREEVGGHATKIEVALQRLDAIEQGRMVKVEAEINGLRERLHELGNQIAAYALQRKGRG